MIQSEGSAQSMLKSVIGAGKASVRKVAASEIESFIRGQPDISATVKISNIRSNADVGASNGIVLFRAEYESGGVPQSRDLVLRHAPGSDSRLFFEYDLSRQFKVQQALQGTGLPVPDALWLDADGAFLGVPGYIMLAASGEAPHTSAFAQGPLASANPGSRRLMLEDVMRNLVKIHQVNYQAIGLEDFTMNAPGVTPLERLINWYWLTWEWISLPTFSRLETVRTWLLKNAPSGNVTLMHGDASLHNYLFKDTSVVGIVDWEMSSLGRPEADLALQIVGNRLFAAPPESGLIQPPSEAQWLELYYQAGGRTVEHFDYFKRFTGYLLVICALSMQRNLPDEVRASQAAFTNRLWSALES